MEFFYTPLSKTNDVIEEVLATSSTNTNVIRQTSTPFYFYNDKHHKKAALDFPSPNSQSASYCAKRAKTTALSFNIINSNLAAEIELKEKYLKDLKSIDLKKYSFQNE